MTVRLKNSKFGEGAGGPCGVVVDANNPSFDPASHETATDGKIRLLLSDDHSAKLSDWEKSFLMTVYGVSPLSRKQHVCVAGILKKHTADHKQD